MERPTISIWGQGRQFFFLQQTRENVRPRAEEGELIRLRFSARRSFDALTTALRDSFPSPATLNRSNSMITTHYVFTMLSFIRPGLKRDGIGASSLPYDCPLFPSLRLNIFPFSTWHRIPEIPTQRDCLVPKKHTQATRLVFFGWAAMARPITTHLQALLYSLFRINITTPLFFTFAFVDWGSASTSAHWYLSFESQEPYRLPTGVTCRTHCPSQVTPQTRVTSLAFRFSVQDVGKQEQPSDNHPSVSEINGAGLGFSGRNGASHTYTRAGTLIIFFT